MVPRSTRETEASWVFTPRASLGDGASAADAPGAPRTSGTAAAADAARNSRRVVMAVSPACRGDLLEFLRLEVVERGLGVGLGPQTDLAGLRERVVCCLQVVLAVQEALDLVADHL